MGFMGDVSEWDDELEEQEYSDEDYEEDEFENFCECGQPGVSNCDCCGAPLCVMCSECQANFCDDCLKDPNFDRKMEQRYTEALGEA
jgi:hypothetical protein